MTGRCAVRCLVAVLLLMSVLPRVAQAMMVDTAQVLWRRPVVFANETEVRSSRSPSGDRILYYTTDGQASFIVVVNVNTGLLYWQGYLDATRGKDASSLVRVEMISDTTYMVVSTAAIFTVDAKTSKVIHEPGPERILSNSITCAVPTYDFRTWFVGGLEGLFRYDYTTGRVDTLSYNPNFYEPDSTVPGHPIGARWVGLSTDERTLYSAGIVEPFPTVPGRLCAWNATTGRQIYQFNEPEGMSFSYLSPFVHGDQVAISNDFKAWVFDLRNGKISKEFPLSYRRRTGVGLSDDASVLAVASFDSLEFYQTSTGEKISRLLWRDVSAMDFLPNRSNDVLLMSAVEQRLLRVRFSLPTNVADGVTATAMRHAVAPNPACGSACVHLVVEEDADAFVRLVAEDGRVVVDRHLGMLPHGTHTTCMDAPPGAYRCMITLGVQQRSLGVVIQ